MKLYDVFLIAWDDDTLSTSDFTEDFGEVLDDLVIVWDNRGQLGIISPAILANFTQLVTDWRRDMNRKAPKPVIKIEWDQTIPLPKNVLEALRLPD